MADQPLVNALAEELATVVGAFLQAETHAIAVSGGWGAGWAVECAVTGPVAGTLAFTMPEADAERLTALVLGADQASEADIVDTLTEVGAQAAGALSQRPEIAGGKIAPQRASRKSITLTAEPVAFELPAGADLTLHVTCGYEPAQTVPAPPPERPAARPAGAAPAYAGPVGLAAVAAAAAPPPPNLDVLMDIELPLTVRFGRTEMPLLAISRLGPGSVIDLGRSPDEPVDVLVNGKVIARGEVVVVAGNYGVRVTEVVSAAERVRSMGA